MGSANIKHVRKVNPSLSIPYTGGMFSAFEFYGMQSRTSSCTGLLSSAWYRNTALPLRVLVINRLEPVGLIVYIHSIVTEHNVVQK
jgi:hypothetical protein